MMNKLTMMELAQLEDEISEALEDLDNGDTRSAIFGLGKLLTLILENKKLESMFPEHTLFRSTLQRLETDLEEVYIKVIKEMHKLTHEVLSEDGE